jgi:hypothetical protein
MFSPTAGGTTDWTYSAAIIGFQSPALGGMVNGSTYTYRAESLDLTQWEVGVGVYNSGTGVLTRAYVLYNSSGTGVGSGQSGAGTKINFSIAPNVGIVAAAEDLGFLYVVTGIDKSGATDVGAALNAFIQSTPQYSTIVLPIGIYNTSVTILVNGGRTLVGCSGGIVAGTLTAGTCIQGQLSLTPVVKVDGGTGSQACGLKNMSITRAAGTVPGGALGLQIWRCNNSTFEDLFISRHAAGIDLLDLNVTINFHRCTVCFCTGFYMQMHAQAIEITCSRCRFGMNGSQDFTGMTGYLYMDGGGWDTIRFTDACQWNNSVGSVVHGIYFNAYNASNPNGIFRIDGLHCEGFTSDFMVFVSCTAKITRLALVNCQINSPSVQLIATAASIDQYKFTGSDFNTLFTIDQQTDGQIAGCIIHDAAVFNLVNGTAISGNTFYGNATLQGASAKVLFGSNVVGGTLSNTGTGITVGTNA